MWMLGKWKVKMMCTIIYRNSENISTPHSLLYHAVKLVNIVSKLNVDELKDLWCTKCVNHIHTISVAFSHQSCRQALLIPLYKLFTFYNQFNWCASMCVDVGVGVGVSFVVKWKLGFWRQNWKPFMESNRNRVTLSRNKCGDALTKCCLFFHNFDKQLWQIAGPMTATNPNKCLYLFSCRIHKHFLVSKSFSWVNYTRFCHTYYFKMLRWASVPWNTYTVDWWLQVETVLVLVLTVAVVVVTLMVLVVAFFLNESGFIHLSPARPMVRPCENASESCKLEGNVNLVFFPCNKKENKQTNKIPCHYF